MVQHVITCKDERGFGRVVDLSSNEVLDGEGVWVKQQHYTEDSWYECQDSRWDVLKD